MVSLLTLNRFHILFSCFHHWIWASVGKVSLNLKAEITVNIKVYNLQTRKTDFEAMLKNKVTITLKVNLEKPPFVSTLQPKISNNLIQFRAENLLAAETKLIFCCVVKTNRFRSCKTCLANILKQFFYLSFWNICKSEFLI